MSSLDRATLHPKGFNDSVALPYGLRVGEVKAALGDVYDFLYNVNRFLVEKGWDRLEETLSAASFSGMLSEMVVQGISKRSATVTKNHYHNGRPDLVPKAVTVQVGYEAPAGAAVRIDGRRGSEPRP